MPDHYTGKRVPLRQRELAHRHADHPGRGLRLGGEDEGRPVGVARVLRRRRHELVEFHNGLNFAGVFKTPDVFLCRNNGWAISVPVEKQTGAQTFAQKGFAYGVPGVRVDGNDLLAVYKATRDAVDRARRGEGPTLIEALTYRLSGHSTSDDPKAYRKERRCSTSAGRIRCPPAAYLERAGLWDDDGRRPWWRSSTRRSRPPSESAEKAAPPPLESLFDDVYATRPAHLQAQYAEALAGPRAKGHGAH
jgi:pyruvate dehydrogenase E1 component alpha subunit